MSAVFDVCVVCHRKLTGKTVRGAVINSLGLAHFEVHRRCRRVIELNGSKREALIREGSNLLLTTAPAGGHA